MNWNNLFSGCSEHVYSAYLYDISCCKLSRTALNLKKPRAPRMKILLCLLVGIAESHMVEKCALKELCETLTVVIEWSVGFPIHRESDNGAVWTFRVLVLLSVRPSPEGKRICKWMKQYASKQKYSGLGKDFNFLQLGILSCFQRQFKVQLFVSFRQISRLGFCFDLFAMIQICTYFFSGNYFPHVRYTRNPSPNFS